MFGFCLALYEIQGQTQESNCFVCLSFFPSVEILRLVIGRQGSVWLYCLCSHRSESFTLNAGTRIHGTIVQFKDSCTIHLYNRMTGPGIVHVPLKLCSLLNFAQIKKCQRLVHLKLTQIYKTQLGSTKQTHPNSNIVIVDYSDYFVSKWDEKENTFTYIQTPRLNKDSHHLTVVDHTQAFIRTRTQCQV